MLYPIKILWVCVNFKYFLLILIIKIIFSKAKNGVLEFKHGEITKTIPITIIDGKKF